MWTQAVDLHCHSHHSDGLWSPSEMAKRAHDAGVKVWSLTDHDTNTGWDEAADACSKLGIRFIPGVEITCAVEMTSETSDSTSWHLLAYFPEGCSPEFTSWLESFKDSRVPRMKSMLSALAEMGHQIPFEDVAKFAEGSIGRPHLARAMIEHGIVETMQQAFDDWIGDSGPAFRERPLPTIAEAVEMVHSSGGITSLAHPGYYGIPSDELVQRLVSLGVDCIEAVHGSHPDSLRFELMQYALPTSVGGDSHGTEKRPSPGKMPVPLKHLHRCFHP